MLIQQRIRAYFTSFSSFAAVLDLNVPVLRLVVLTWINVTQHSAWDECQREASETEEVRFWFPFLPTGLSR